MERAFSVGTVLHRLRGETNPVFAWHSRATVVYENVLHILRMLAERILNVFTIKT